EPTLHPLAYVENLPDAKAAVFNSFLPTPAALSALLRNVGFDEVRVFPIVQSDRAVFACRKRQPYPDSHAISYLESELALISGPSSCRPNDELRFQLRLHNSGYARWLSGTKGVTKKGDVHLVAHLLSEDEQPISWYHAGAFLPHDVPPNETVEVEIVLRAPESAGNYLLEFDMVSEHLVWFEDLGSEVLKHQLKVE